MKKTGVVIDNLEGYIWLVQRFSERKISSSDCSASDRKYTLEDLDLALGTILLVVFQKDIKVFFDENKLETLDL